MKYYLSIFMVLFSFLPLLVRAQEEATLLLRPENPRPNEPVTVTLSSYSFDVNVATITWSVNGKTVLSGLGKKSLSIPLGNVGQELVLTVTASTEGGPTITQRITIAPQSVDLVYHGKEGYVPPFYEGKTLPAEGSAVRIVAVPSIAESGKKIPSSNLSFSWYVNDEYQEMASGVGKSSFDTSLNYLSESTNIRVLVRSPAGNAAEKQVSIYPHAVLPLFYKYNTLLGTDFSKVFARRLELSGDITLSLEPFYLSTKNLEQTASYSWYIDGLPVTPEEKTLLSLRPKENTSGVRTLSVSITQTKRRLQKVEESLQVLFDTRK